MLCGLFSLWPPSFMEWFAYCIGTAVFIEVIFFYQFSIAQTAHNESSLLQDITDLFFPSFSIKLPQRSSSKLPWSLQLPFFCPLISWNLKVSIKHWKHQPERFILLTDREHADNFLQNPSFSMLVYINGSRSCWLALPW